MEIENLEEKLKGKLPVTRGELFTLVNSWGRKSKIYGTNDNITIPFSKPAECYPLENLDISKIKDLSFIFNYSPYNGDLSKWDVSNIHFMMNMFDSSEFNNDSISNWNVKNLFNTKEMFINSKFNQDISKWNISDIRICNKMFENSKFDGDISNWNFTNIMDCDGIFNINYDFIDKYNAGKKIPFTTVSFLKWFEDNKENISNLNISKEELNDIDNYLISFEKNGLNAISK